MKISRLTILALVAGAWLAGGCNDGAPYTDAYRVTNRTQLIGGPAALAELGDYILENDRIRIAMPQRGNSVGPGVFGGSLMDADIHRPQAQFRNGNGRDGFGELFPIGNLTIPAICLDGEKDKIDDVAIVRLEQIYPFPGAKLGSIIERYPAAAELVWAQEEPQNMGAWRFVRERFLDGDVPGVAGRSLRYVGRAPSAAPAPGTQRAHVREQQVIVRRALSGA